MPLRRSKTCLAGALLLLFAAAATPSAAQFNNTSHDARTDAMGGVFLHDSLRHVSLFYRQSWLLADIADKRVSLTMPLATHWMLWTGYLHHGNYDYHEQQASLGVAMRVEEWLRIGVGGRLLHIGVADAWYEPQRWLGADAMAELWPNSSTTALFVAGTRPWDKDCLWYARTQVSYRPSTTWLTVVALESDDRIRIRGGVEYTYREVLSARAGMATNPMVVTCGMGVKQGALGLDLAVQVHSSLGVSPSCSIQLWF